MEDSEMILEIYRTLTDDQKKEFLEFLETTNAQEQLACENR